MATHQPIFILGMPRCRTAWLSMCLSVLGVHATHEAMRDHATFEGYAYELDGWLHHGPAGDADPALHFWLDELLGHWPDARFIVVSREDDEGLEAFLASARFADEHRVRSGWSAYLTAFKAACDKLRARGGALFVPLDVLTDDIKVADVLEFATGDRPCPRDVARLQRLRVVSRVEPLEGIPTPKAAPVLAPRPEGFDTAGLSVAMYRNADFSTVAAWWHRHTGTLLQQAMLPPLGVTVLDESGDPLAALWCLESFGVPVAEIVYPVTRPGLDLKRASAAIALGISACIAVAGRGHTPPASFRVFKALPTPAMTRVLARLGFRESQTDRVPMVLHL